tara:strand:- start:770 stop:1666 length:897 start_codon:yes stop_codon:yes gene_type:complete
MGMFKFAKEESKGSPLFAASLASSAVGAMPTANYLRDTFLIPEIKSLDTQMAMNAGDIGDLAKRLKTEMLDKGIKDKIHITTDPKKGSFFRKTRKNYLPQRKEVEALLASGGLKTLEGEINPIKAIKDIREAGGFVNLGKSSINPVTLAHELGHASALNKGQALRASGIYDFADSLGRRVQRSGTRGALGAAILAGSFSSDDDTKWLVPGGIALTQAPLLAEEGVASARGLRALKALKGVESGGSDIAEKLLSKAVEENAGRYLRRAWGTYGLGTYGLLAAPLFALGARKQFDKWSKD